MISSNLQHHHHNQHQPTPPHPTGNWSWKSSAFVCRTARKMMRLLCLCVPRNMNVIVPPHPTGIWSWKSSACFCRTARKMMRLRCLCVHRNMGVIVPPHPTAPHSEQWWKCSDYFQNERGWGCTSGRRFAHWVRKWVRVRKWVKFRVRKWGSDPATTTTKTTLFLYVCVTLDVCLTEGSLEVKLPTIWTDEKQRWEESEKIEKKKVSEERRSRCAKR